MKIPAVPRHSWPALLLWTALGGLRLGEAVQFARVIPAVLAVQSLLAAWLIATRRQERAGSGWSQKLTAWVSAFLPLALQIQHETRTGQVVSCLGLLLVLWSMAILGRSFGIAPADRGLVMDGPYRLVRHPMYLGELICLAGAMLGDISLWNMVLFLAVCLALLLRIRWEERILWDYASYAGRVSWRLIPWLW